MKSKKIMKLGLHNFIIFLLFFPLVVLAEPIEKNTAVLKLLDKTSNKVDEKKIEVNKNVKWGSLEISIFSCYSSPSDEIPEDYVLIEIIDKLFEEQGYIYRGWMISSSPEVTPLQHPIYDLWLVDCINDITS